MEVQSGTSIERGEREMRFAVQNESDVKFNFAVGQCVKISNGWVRSGIGPSWGKITRRYAHGARRLNWTFAGYVACYSVKIEESSKSAQWAKVGDTVEYLMHENISASDKCSA